LRAAAAPAYRRRVTDRDNNFDLIRLLAALQVAVTHAWAWLGMTGPMRWPIAALEIFSGVPVFFFISGFLVTRSYGASRSMGTFFAKRALRIYPALIGQYVFVVVLMAATRGFDLRQLFRLATWEWFTIAAAAGSDFWANAITGRSPFNFDAFYKGYPADVLWSISAELGFYLLVPLICAPWLARRGLILVSFAAWAALSLGTNYLAGSLATAGAERLWTSPLPYLWVLMLGAAAAAYWETLRPLFEGRLVAWLAAYLVVCGTGAYVFGIFAIEYRQPGLFAALRVVLLAGTVLAFAHTWPHLARVLRGNDLSYGIYLFHMPFIYGVYYAGVRDRWDVFALSPVVAIALAAVSWFAVERPALRLKTKYKLG
jgi:peptidoglycan/LPS O-acetylase OafA/YrhL